MEFLFYCRDKPGVGALLQRHVEAHWSFMDGYAGRLLTRGPTLTEDGEEHTGSLHIVQLDSVAETDGFAYQEPFYRAGCYGAVVIRRWNDRLGRSMRDFKPASENPLFLILGHAAPGAQPTPFTAGPGIAVYGWTHALDGSAWTGYAAIVQAPRRDAAAALLSGAPAVAATEIHRWCVGGRR